MGIKITKKQKLILDFLISYMEENGESPSYREIATGVGLSSVASVAEHIDNLIDKGILQKNPGEPRSLEVLDYEHLETVELFKNRLITATAEESRILLKAMDILGLDLPE